MKRTEKKQEESLTITYEHCMERTSKGCIRCGEGYFLREFDCYECQNRCKTCTNETYCLTCPGK